MSFFVLLDLDSIKSSKIQLLHCILILLRQLEYNSSEAQCNFLIKFNSIELN